MNATMRLAVSGAAVAAATYRTASTLAVAAAAVAKGATPQPPAAAAGKAPPGRRVVVESSVAPVEIPNETLPEFIWRKSAHLAGHKCITCAVSGRGLTYAEMRAAARRWAQALLGPLQLRPGDTLALLLPNLPEYVPAVHGSLMAGVRVTMANPLYTAEEVARQLGDAGARLVLTTGTHAAKARRAAGPHAPLVVVQMDGDDQQHDEPLPPGTLLWQEVLSSASGAEVALPKTDPEAVAALPYSSGTTGLPKGVLLSHRNLVADLALLQAPELHYFKPATDEFQEVGLTVLPFYHIYGFNGVLNLGLMWGAHTISMPVFTPEAYLRTLVDYKPTLLSVVPSLLQFLAVHPAVTREMLASVRTVVSGAAPATAALIAKFRSKVGHDIVFSQGYGMTESSPVTLLPPPRKARAKETSVGRLLPLTRARVLRPDGHDALPGEPGELLVAGPQIMKGYHKNEKATRETVDEEGWLHTGDVCYYDEDHYFYIIDRTKELIKVKGNQVSPTELENLIMELPEVADCAVVGIPDERHDEIPRAFIVLHPKKTLSEEHVKNHVEPKVVKYKHLLGGVKFLDKIPRNPSGKILRHELKAWKPEK